MGSYLKDNLLVGLQTLPREAFMLSFMLTIAYGVIALITGFAANLFEVGLVES
jgi:hypothetical protein